jgi:hypothetical protein
MAGLWLFHVNKKRMWSLSHRVQNLHTMAEWPHSLLVNQSESIRCLQTKDDASIEKVWFRRLSLHVCVLFGEDCSTKDVDEELLPVCGISDRNMAGELHRTVDGHHGRTAQFVAG